MKAHAVRRWPGNCLRFVVTKRSGGPKNVHYWNWDRRLGVVLRSRGQGDTAHEQGIGRASARTTLRNIIGTLTLKSANSERGKINTDLQKTMREETNHWGIEIVRTELKEIDPPKDVQETMNKVVKAENEKVAAVDFATATETMADGARRAQIKMAEGIKQAKILEAEGEAQAIQLVNQAADKVALIGTAPARDFR